MLTGELSPKIGDLVYLTGLYLSNDRTPSQLVGPIPDTIQNLHELRCFYVSHNKLSGPLPSWLGTLTKLVGLYLRVNKFSGTFPDLSTLTNLTDFWFDTNFITGNLSSLSKLQYLSTVKGFVNELGGLIPSNLCSVDNCILSLNNFKCPLPTTGCCDVNSCEQKDKNASQKRLLRNVFSLKSSPCNDQ